MAQNKMYYLAQAAHELAPTGGLHGVGPFQTIPTTPEGIGNKIATVISQVIGLLSIVAIIWFVLQLVLAGITIISAGGNKEKIAETQKRITYSALGLLVALLATFLVAILSYIFNIDFLNLGSILEKLR